MTTYVTRTYHQTPQGPAYTEEVEHDGHEPWDDDEDLGIYCPKCGFLERAHKDGKCPASEKEAAYNLEMPTEAQADETNLERIKTNLKRWAIAESDDHPYASKWVDYYEALLKREEARRAPGAGRGG